MPKKTSYYKIAAFFAQKKFGTRSSVGEAAIFSKFSDHWSDRLKELEKQIKKETDPAWKAIAQQNYDALLPMVNALKKFDNASYQLSEEASHNNHRATTASRKAKLETAAAAAEAFEKAYDAYLQAHPYIIQEDPLQRDFHNMWTEENYDNTGDELLKETGYDAPEYSMPPDYVPAPPSAPDPEDYAPDGPAPVKEPGVPKEPNRPIFANPLPRGTTPQQLVSHLSAGISPEGKAVGDAALLVNFHRSLYEQYNKYQTRRQTALQAGEDTSVLDRKMSVVSQLYTSIQNTLNGAHKLKVAAVSGEADAEAKQQAMSEALFSGMTMAHQFGTFKKVCAEDLKDIPGYQAFDNFWSKGMLRGGEDVMAALGMLPTEKSAEYLQKDIAEAHTPWPNIITQEELQKKGSFNQDAAMRLIALMASAGISTQDREAKEALSTQGSALTKLLGVHDKSPYYEKQLLRAVSSLPQVLKKNYEALAQKADEDPEYGRELFHQDLKKLSDHLGLDISELNLPEKAVVDEEAAPLRSWQGQIRKVRGIQNHPLNLASYQLARLLVCKVNESKNVPFSYDRMDKAIKDLQETLVFKQIAKNPDRCLKLIREKNTSEIFDGITHPFQAAPLEKKRTALEKLKIYKDSGYLFPTKGRSPEWQNFSKAIEKIDLSKPETYDQQIQNIIDADEAYMKGKKALSRDPDRNERVDECMDVMNIISEISPYVKDRVNLLVDRTNQIRTRWNRHQPTFDMDDYDRQSVASVDKLHKLIVQAREDPEKMNLLKNEPRLNNQSLVHPILDEGWEIVDQLKAPAPKEEGPQISF